MGLRWFKEYFVAFSPLKAFRKWEIDFSLCLLRWESLSLIFQCDFEFFLCLRIWGNQGKKTTKGRRSEEKIVKHDMKFNDLGGFLQSFNDASWAFSWQCPSPRLEKRKLGLCYVCLTMKRDDVAEGEQPSPPKIKPRRNTTKIMCKFSDLMVWIFLQQFQCPPAVQPSQCLFPHQILSMPAPFAREGNW